MLYEVITPSQIDELLTKIEGASSEYQVMIDHMEGKDLLTLFVEQEDGYNSAALEENLKEAFKNAIGIAAIIKVVGMGDLPRSEKKTARIFDNRY